jgi:hypothetical protein
MTGVWSGYLSAALPWVNTKRGYFAIISMI